MKKLLTLLAAVFLATSHAEEAAQAGPLGGRLLALDGGKAEFFVEPDRTVTVAFYDEALQKTAPSGQVVTAIADAPSGKATLAFEPKDGVLKSTTPLPEGAGYTVVLQIRPAADARPKNFRITYETHACGECGRPEYACTCAH